MRTRRFNFYGHINRMEPLRPTKQIIEIYKNKTKAVKVIYVVEYDLDAVGTKQTYIRHRRIFRRNVFDWKFDQREKR